MEGQVEVGSHVGGKCPARGNDLVGPVSSKMPLQEFVGVCERSATEAKFNALAAAVGVARSYRGKVLSFERGDSYSGKSTGVMVHRSKAR
jgi:hypothetical protein